MHFPELRILPLLLHAYYNNTTVMSLLLPQSSISLPHNTNIFNVLWHYPLHSPRIILAALRAFNDKLLTQSKDGEKIRILSYLKLDL